MYSSEVLDELASPEALSSSAFDCDPEIPGLEHDFDPFDIPLDEFPETLLPRIPFSPEYPSPEHSPAQTRETADTQQRPQEAATKPKRKRENRYKNAPPSVLSRRRAQNRASQRAYRERKDQRIKDLEGIITDLERKNDVLSKAYDDLKLEYWKLKAQCDAPPQQLPISWDPSLPQLGDGMLYYSESTMNMTNFQI
ncbi:hypothetical protein F4801DRAFT_547855 [Xylaria longipes]|nr:hypothetical protein F4801DRAFT_547855 [Xylaria longipes]RYC61088.1 hypothetical protein CHU98_g5114 [Xylaria longipes]